MAPIEEQSAVLTFPQPPTAFCQPPTANYSPKAANKTGTKYDFDLLNNNVGIKNVINISSTAQPLLVDSHNNRRAASELSSEKSAKMAAVAAAANSSSSGHIIRSSSLGPANPRQHYLEAAYPGRPGSRTCYLEPLPPQTNNNNNSIYETNYETIDGYSSGSGSGQQRTSDDCAITMLENAVRCLNAGREAKARQQQLYQQKALMFNNKDLYNNNDNFNNVSSASRLNNKVQYDSITVLGGGRDTPPPPPPPLPRTKSFKDKEAVAARVKLLNGGGGDGRASSAPPISPYLYRKFGLYKRLDFYYNCIFLFL